MIICKVPESGPLFGVFSLTLENNTDSVGSHSENVLDSLHWKIPDSE